MIESIFENLFTPLSEEERLSRQEALFTLISQYEDELRQRGQSPFVQRELNDKYRKLSPSESTYFWQDVWAVLRGARKAANYVDFIMQDYRKWKAKQ